MREFQGRRKAKKMVYSKPVLLLLMVVIFLLGRAVWAMYERDQFTRSERAKIELTLKDLTDRKAMLADTLDALNTTEGQEQAMRDKFSVVSPDEYMVTVVNKEKTPEPVATTTKHWWQGWFNN